MKYISIENCLTGSNGGFLGDDAHYNNATLKKLKKKIKSFNSDISDEEYVDYAAQLDTMLAGVEDELNKLREKLKVNENGRATINDAVNETESVLENALEISTASKKKKYKELLKLRNIKASDKAKLFFVLRVALTLDGDGIEYDSKSIKMIVELYNSCLLYTSDAADE